MLESFEGGRIEKYIIYFVNNELKLFLYDSYTNILIISK